MRNSIDFYKQAINDINSMTFDYYPSDKWSMYQILAASTTRSNHSAKTAEEEEKEQAIWVGLCELIDKIDRATLTLQTIASLQPDGLLKHNVTYHFNRLKEQPNIAFLESIVKHVIDYVQSLNMAWVVATLTIGADPLGPLVEFSDQISAMIIQHQTDFYHGARFFFQNGVWETLSVEKYTALQYQLNQANSNLSKLIAPHLSTFNITNILEHDPIYTSDYSKVPLLRYALDIFRDVESNRTLQQSHLRDVLHHFLIHHFGDKPHLEILAYLEEHFAHCFKPNYFAEKRQQIVDATLGLTQNQIDKIRKLRFLEPQEKAIIAILSQMVKLNPEMTDNHLDAFCDQFITLRHMILAEDFTLFTERLSAIKNELPPQHDIVSQLIALIIEKRSLEDFNQIYTRNKIEKVKDASLVNKFIIFIKQLKPLTLDNMVVDRTALQEMLATLVLNTDSSSLDEAYVGHINTLVKEISDISKNHPHIQHYLLDSFNHLPEKNQQPYLKNMKDCGHALYQLSQILTAGVDTQSKENMLVIYSLFAFYHTKPMDLVSLLKEVTRLPEPEHQRFMLTFISRLLDNGQSIEGLHELIEQFSAEPGKIILLSKVCATPPYPDIQTLDMWFRASNFVKNYEAFSLRPYGARKIAFAFNRQKYDKQSDQFEGGSVNDLFSDEIGDRLQQELASNRKANIESLRKNVQQLKENAQTAPLTDEDKLKLLCAAIEMLARTTPQNDLSDTPRVISQELNTTQVMALYHMIVNPSNQLISEIDTGEGKSRIMMILAAIQATLGKTVDFITSDMQLAERDYLSYKQFFNALNIRTSLISLNTPPQLYQKGGVNFSDNNQLLLLRNKSDIDLNSFAYLDEQEENRCLLIDEVDKFMHDKSKDSYNYASSSKRLKGYVWIYPLLMQFMTEQLLKDNNQNLEMALLIDPFIQYVSNHDASMIHQASLAELKIKDQNQLIIWLNSAFLATKMEKDRHYKESESDESKLYSVKDLITAQTFLYAKNKFMIW